MSHDLTREEQEKALECATRGDGNEDVCNALRISLYAFWRYRESNPQFAERYKAARCEGARTLVDQLRALHVIEPDVPRATLQAANVKWLAARLVPEEFSETMRVNHTHTVDLLGTIERSRARAEASLIATQLLPEIRPAIADAEYERIEPNCATDSESGAEPEPAIGEGDVYR